MRRAIVICALVAMGCGGGDVDLAGIWDMQVVTASGAVSYEIEIQHPGGGECEFYNSQWTAYVVTAGYDRLCSQHRDGSLMIEKLYSYPKGLCLTVGCVVWLNLGLRLSVDGGRMTGTSTLNGPSAGQTAPAMLELRRR